MTDFKLLIIDWYRQNKRDLPWRSTKDPFKIWLSEILLQQTRVAQGLPYYLKFTATFKDIHRLASADEQTVLSLWQGLGYYSRARNLHQTAKHIAQNYNGKFPTSYNELVKLKGIGPYTAAAIASFCYNEVVPVVDGNVARVISRVFDVSAPINKAEGLNAIKALTELLIDQADPASFNQAIMEFGALQCTPKKPNCASCVLQEICLSRSRNTVPYRPVKQKKQHIKDRYFHAAYIHSETEIVLDKRKSKDIWQHLFQFPLLETIDSSPPKEISPFLSIDKLTVTSPPTKHLLSHQRLHVQFYHFKLEKIPLKALSKYIIVSKSELINYPLPRPFEKFLLGK